MSREDLPAAVERNGAVVLFAVLGLMPLAVQPAFVSVLTEFGGFGARAAGFIVSFEAFGITAATMLSIFLRSRLERRMLCRVGVSLLVIANVISIAMLDALGLAFARFAAGFASGLLLALGYSVAATARNPGQVYGYVIASTAAAGTVGVVVLPMLASYLGTGGAFSLLAITGAVAWPTITRLPAGHAGERASFKFSSPDLEGTVKLASATCLFVGLGAVWAYVGEIGLTSGVSSRAVSISLGISQLASVGGALLVGPLCRWLAVETILAASVGLTTGFLVLMNSQMSAPLYGIAVSGFNAASNISVAAAVSAVASLRQRGALTDIVATLQVGGFAVGPAIAAAIIAHGDYSGVRWVAMTLIVISVLLAFSYAPARVVRQS